MRKWSLRCVAVAVLAIGGTSHSGALAQDEGDDPFGNQPTAPPAPAAAARQSPLPHFRLRGYAEVSGGPVIAYLEVDAERLLVRAGETFAARTAGDDASFEVVAVADGSVTLRAKGDGRLVVVR